MDQVSTLQRLFRYKAAANDEMLAAMRHFDGAAPARQIVIRILSHTYVVDQIFAAHLRRAGHSYASANAGRAPSLEELSEAIPISDRWYVDYVSRLDRAQLAERIDFTFTDGEPGSMSREEMLMHVMTHGAGHRGQASWIMMENSITPPADRFTTYLHKAEAATRGRPAAVSRDSTRTAENEDGAGLSLDALTARIRTALDADSRLGKTLKFDLKGAGFVYIDGASVTNEDRPADLTLTVTVDDLDAISQGRLAPMTAMVSGRLGLSDMDVALGLQSRMQALFSRMHASS